MKKTLVLSALAASMLASFTAQAADSANLIVTGVIRPAACKPNFTGGGTVDYGSINSGDIPANEPKVLGEMTIPFSVTCDGATKIAIRSIDQRKDSVVSGLVAKVANVNEASAHGLGTVDGKKIGAYVLSTVNGSVQATDATGTPVAAVDLLHYNGSQWSKNSAIGNLIPGSSGTKQSFAMPGTLEPGAFKTVTGTLAVNAVIDKGSNLPLNQEITLDGLTTLEVEYL